MHERAFTITRAEVNDDGTFRAVLFTNGEASDGNILHIPGGAIPKRMPLFINHRADPTTQLGSIYFDSRDDDSITVRGEIMLDGEGEAAEIRRDVFAKIRAGHVDRMSGRWDADDKHVTRRVNLPKDHYAHVKDKEEDFRKRYGYFFEKWRAMEGSVVGLGADPQAVMRWAEDENSSETVREFWRGMAEEETKVESLDPTGFDSEESFILHAVPLLMEDGARQETAISDARSIWNDRKKDLDDPVEDLGKVIRDLVKEQIMNEIKLDDKTRLSFDDLRQMRDLLGQPTGWVAPKEAAQTSGYINLADPVEQPPELDGGLRFTVIEGGDKGPDDDEMPEAAVQTTTDQDQEPGPEGRLAAFGAYVREMMNSGLDPTDLRGVVESETENHPSTAIQRELAETRRELAEIKELLVNGNTEREDKGDPLPPAPPAEDVAREIVAVMRQKAEEKAQHKLDSITKRLSEKVETRQPSQEPTPGDIGRVLRDELRKARQANLTEVREVVKKAGGTGKRTSQADEIRDLIKRALKR
jgi:hypothetical protein